LEDHPNHGGLWQLLGLIHRQLGDWYGSLAALETASALVPLERASRCALADCYARLDKPALALDLYRHLADDPSCPTAILPAVASGLGSLGEDRAALAVCRRLVAAEPDRHEAHFGVAFYLRRLGEPLRVAMPMVERAHELAPAVPLYRVSLASMLDVLGRRDEAYEPLREVDPRAVGCGCCLRRMMDIFLNAGDSARLADCRRREQATHGPEPDY